MLKDTETADIIREISRRVQKLISFDVTSLFTNIPLMRTINVILNRIYNEKLVNNTIKKNTMRKLLRDTYTETTFMCNGNIYKQIDDVRMGGSSGPVLLANVIMTDLEKVHIRKLIDDGTIKFYARCVDDTLLVIKAENIDRIHRELE